MENKSINETNHESFELLSDSVNPSMSIIIISDDIANSALNGKLFLIWVFSKTSQFYLASKL